jgi:hypothetical protein
LSLDAAVEQRRREDAKAENKAMLVISPKSAPPLTGECDTAPELAISQRFLRVFAPLLFISNGGV